MSITLESAARLNALKQGIEAKTGETYDDLTGGVNALIAGFGQGSSGGADIDALIDRSITDISGNQTTIGKSAFRDCSALKSASFPHAKSIGDFGFASCQAMTNVNFPEVVNIAASAFQTAQNVKEINFPKAETVGANAFSGCYAIKSIDLPNVNSLGSRAFQTCRNCASYNLPNVTKIDTYTFYENQRLVVLDLPKVTSIGAAALGNCYRMTALILRSPTLCALANSNAFNSAYKLVGEFHGTWNPNTEHDGYVYVPSALVTQYPTATNWSAINLQYRALEDYTVDGTITGALDENKIGGTA
jgi:hypothetical protein